MPEISGVLANGRTALGAASNEELALTMSAALTIGSFATFKGLGVGAIGSIKCPSNVPLMICCQSLLKVLDFVIMKKVFGSF